MIIDPAVKGTMNVLKASHAAQTKRVVGTSSICALYPNPTMPPGTVVDENWWTDIDFCKEKGEWYPVSKTLSEKAAWEFATQTGLDIVTIQPSYVLGRMLNPMLHDTAAFLVNLMKGSSDSPGVKWIGAVDVQDVARAHILLYENPSAKGRYQCNEAITHFSDFAEQVAQMYPQYNVHRFKEETQPGLLCCSNPSKKLMDLGFAFTPLENGIRDNVSSLQEFGFLTI